MVSGATGRRTVDVSDFLAMEIPQLLPLEQERVAEELDRLIQVTDGVEKVNENWRFLVPAIDAELVELGDLLANGKLTPETPFFFACTNTSKKIAAKTIRSANC